VLSRVCRGYQYLPALRLRNYIKSKYRVVQHKGSVTFTEFVHYLIDPRTRPPYNVHWRTFQKSCYPCEVQYNFIGHYETLAEDSNYVINMFGFRVRQFPRLNILYKSYRRVIEMFANLTETEINRLVEIYRIDFDLFGYSANLSHFIS